MSILVEKISDLENAIDNLRSCFNDFDFLTKCGLTVEDISDISGFEKFVLDDSDIIYFENFCLKIKKSLVSLDDEVEKSEFDWDYLSHCYEDAVDKYKEYSNLKEQIEENLTDQQEFENVSIHQKDDIKDALLNYMIEENLLKEINSIDGEVYYLVNPELEKKLDL